MVEAGIGVNFFVGTDIAAPRYYARWIRPGMTIYDVGANKGQMALLFAALVGPTGRVISFEPAPAEFASLERNLELNKLKWAEALQLAASDSEGILSFTYSEDHPTEGRLLDFKPDYPSPTGKQISVKTVLLDNLPGNHPAPDAIKIDVEGAGAAVLRGARRMLEEVGPIIWLELHNQDEKDAVKEELFTRGYVAVTIEGKPVDDPSVGWHGPLCCYKPKPT